MISAVFIPQILTRVVIPLVHPKHPNFVMAAKAATHDKPQHARIRSNSLNTSLSRSAEALITIGAWKPRKSTRGWLSWMTAFAAMTKCEIKFVH